MSYFANFDVFNDNISVTSSNLINLVNIWCFRSPNFAFKVKICQNFGFWKVKISWMQLNVPDSLPVDWQRVLERTTGIPNLNIQQFKRCKSTKLDTQNQVEIHCIVIVIPFKIQSECLRLRKSPVTKEEEKLGPNIPTSFVIHFIPAHWFKTRRFPHHLNQTTENDGNSQLTPLSATKFN